MTFAQKNRLFAFLFFVGFCLMAATLAGSFFTAPDLLFGLFPQTVLWALACTFYLLLLLIGGYYWLFRPWARRSDDHPDREPE